MITESGFGSDMGMEKFFDIVCRVEGSSPAPSCSCARSARSSTTGARGSQRRPAAGPRGAGDGREQHAPAHRDRQGVRPAVRGGDQPPPGRHERGGRDRRAGWRWSSARTAPRSTRASSVAARAPPTLPGGRRRGRAAQLRLIYRDEDPIIDKISAVARRVYGASDVYLYPEAEKKSRSTRATASATCRSAWPRRSSRSRPTRSCSTRPRTSAAGARHPCVHGRGLARAAVRRHHADARLGKTPAAFDVDLESDGRIVGLF